MNDHKAALFAKAKADGFDPKALRTAFRQRVREIENSGETAKYGKLTESCLVVLRSEVKGDGGISYSSPVSPAPTEPAPEALARSHAHTRTREAGSHDTNDALIGLTDSKDPRRGSTEMDVSADDELEVPLSLRCSQDRPASTSLISTQQPTNTDPA